MCEGGGWGGGWGGGGVGRGGGGGGGGGKREVKKWVGTERRSKQWVRMGF